jgi:hypothetical protein
VREHDGFGPRQGVGKRPIELVGLLAAALEQPAIEEQAPPLELDQVP